MNTEKFIPVYQNATSKELEAMEQHLLDAVNSLVSEEHDAPETAENVIEDLKLEIFYIQGLLYGTTIPVFPDDFQEKVHTVIPGAKQWVYPKEGEVLVSIIGGGQGIYGDGVRTFEMFDFREGDVQSHLLKDEINEHFKNNPFLNIGGAGQA